MFGALGQGMPISMAGGCSDSGMGGGGQWGWLIALLLLGRNGFGMENGGRVGNEVAALPALTALTSEVSNIKGQLSEFALDNAVEGIPAKAAAAVTANLCEPLCAIRSAVSALPDKMDMFSQFSSLNNAVTNGVTVTNANINSFQNNTERSFGVVGLQNRDTQQLVQSTATALSGQIDRGFCNLQHDLDNKFCATNANVVAQSQMTRDLIRDQFTAQILADKDGEIAALRRQEQNTLIVGNNNSVQQGLININQNFQALSSKLCEIERTQIQQGNTLIQIGAGNLGGQSNNGTNVNPLRA